MKKIILLAGILAIIGSCKKKSDDETENKIPGEFYISFTTTDSTYMIKSGDKYTYIRGGSTGTYPQYTFTPNIYLTPLPLNMNLYLIGLQFNYTPACLSCDPDMKKYGNDLFYAGPRNICKNAHVNTQIYEVYCPGNDGVAIFWTEATGKRLVSTAGDQPSGNFFFIDSVADYHYDGNKNSTLAFDKIITGRFACRVFDPTNKTYYKDLKQGTFRMPIWYNKYSY